ncbi:hypothetical protein [Winogradskyella sp.]|nr:hypothetical protein [Winogradskyella sp.]
MNTKQIHKQPMSRFNECGDYRWAVILLSTIRGRFVSIFRS